MKIAIADETNLKFCNDLKDHWEKLGHEVKYESGASEFLAQEVDLYYIEFWTHNIHYLFNWYLEHPKARKPKIVVRLIDWDIWIGLARDQRIIDWVDKAICIAPHLEKKLRADNNWHDLKLIRPGVNLDKFTLKTTKTDGFQLGMVLGDMWWYKNHMGGLDIFTTLYQQDPRWRLHIRGQHEGGEYNKVMYEHYLESRGIKEAVTLYPRLEDMNQWLEQIDILLHPGMKEGFCYAVAEAMAKGIPAVVNEFYGSKDIWKGIPMIYNTHQTAVVFISEINKHLVDQIITKDRTSYIKLRNKIEDNYSLERQLKETDEWIGI